MADANLKARPRKPKDSTTEDATFHVTLLSLAERPDNQRPCMPWMDVIDRHIEVFGFKPGERVFLSIDHRHAQIYIGPDFEQRRG